MNSVLKSNERFKSSYVIRQGIPFLRSSISEAKQSAKRARVGGAP